MGPLYSKNAELKELTAALEVVEEHESSSEEDEWHDPPQNLDEVHGEVTYEIARAYQTELVEKAKNQNLIICLPTGSGKTFIALELAKYFLSTGVEENKKVIFLANTVQLVLQQAEYFKKHLNCGELCVSAFYGSKGMDSWSPDKWKKKIQSCKVLVMISKVFYNVLNRHITMGQVSLLIFDECHHADQSHDMKEIMNSYFTIKNSDPKYPLPRILGLTATLISDNGRSGNVEYYVKLMESNLDSRAITYHDYDQVLRHSTNAKIKYVIFDGNESLEVDDPNTGMKESFLDILNQGKDQLRASKSVDDEPDSKLETVRRDFINYIDDICAVHLELGPFCAISAAQQKLANITVRGQTERDEKLLDLICIITRTLRSYLNPLRISKITLNSYSAKVEKLLEELKGWKSRHPEEELCGMIFVERRTTATTLNAFLKTYIQSNPEEFWFLKPGFVVGANRGVDGLEELIGIQTYQKEVVEKFFRKDFNLIICTSILEEGLNVPSCNVIWRFDGLASYRSFIQSMGRARDQNAEFIIFLSTTCAEEEIKQIHGFQKFNIELADYLKEKALRLEDSDWKENEKPECMESKVEPIPSFCPGGTPDSPRITLRTAVSLVYQYCQVLCTDRPQSVPEPVIIWKTINFQTSEQNSQKPTPGLGFQAIVTLPPTALVTEQVAGPILPSKKLAKQATFLEICKKLYAAEAFDELLLPKRPEIKTQVDATIEKYNDLDGLNFMLPSDQSQEKFPNWFYKKIPNYLKGSFVEPKTKLYVYQIQLKLSDPRGGEKEDIYRFENKRYSYAIVLAKPLDFIPEFELITSAGYLNCSLKNLTEEMDLNLTHTQIQSLIQYQKDLFFRVLQLNLRLAELRKEVEYLVVPLIQCENQTFSISWTSVETIGEIITVPDSYRIPPSLEEILEMNFEDCESQFEDSLVVPWYNRSQKEFAGFHAVSKIFTDKSLLEEFEPRSTQLQSETTGPNFIDFFHRKYGVLIQHRHQPLLRCTRLTKTLNFFSKTFVHQLNLSQDPTRKVTDKSCITLFPELVRIFPYSGTLLAQSRFLPSILHRIERLLIAHEIQVGMAKESLRLFAMEPESPPPAFKSEVSISTIETIDIKLLELELLQKPESTSSTVTVVGQRNSDCDYQKVDSSPSIITLMEAMTVAGANDCFNLERLETIGDSFLKYCATMHICTNFPKFNEGKMSRLRTKIVSNSSLNNVGTRFGIGELMSGAFFYPEHTYLPRSFELPEKYVEVVVKLDGNLDLFDQRSPEELQEMNLDELMELATQRLKQGLSTQTPKARLLNYSKLREKDVSDCVEALIGAYYIHGGSQAALQFMTYIGFIVPNGEKDEVWKPFGSWCIQESELQESLLRFHTPPEFFPKIKEFQELIGYRFRNEWNLVEAFTHSSYYTKNRITPSYERMEFLGDAVLDLLVTSHILEYSELKTPGQLTDVRSALVNNVTLGSLAHRYGFQNHLLHTSPFLEHAIKNFASLQERFKDEVGVGQFELIKDENGNSIAVDVQTPKVLGDLYESLAGAIFVDSKGSLEQVWKIFHRLMKPEIDKFTKDVPIAPLRQIYEWDPTCIKVRKASENGGGRSLSGKPLAIVTMLGQVFYGTGTSEKSAKEAAAKHCIRELKSQFPGFNGPLSSTESLNFN